MPSAAGSAAGAAFRRTRGAGVGVWIGVQAFINIGVNMGVLPTKGLTLPLCLSAAAGSSPTALRSLIVMRVDYENRRLLRGFAL
jgi:cell division protein FtsW